MCQKIIFNMMAIKKKNKSLKSIYYPKHVSIP